MKKIKLFESFDNDPNVVFFSPKKLNDYYYKCLSLIPNDDPSSVLKDAKKELYKAFEEIENLYNIGEDDSIFVITDLEDREEHYLPITAIYITKAKTHFHALVKYLDEYSNKETFSDTIVYSDHLTTRRNDRQKFWLHNVFKIDESDINKFRTELENKLKLWKDKVK
jgi:hypothetical protein